MAQLTQETAYPGSGNPAGQAEEVRTGQQGDARLTPYLFLARPWRWSAS